MLERKLSDVTLTSEAAPCDYVNRCQNTNSEIKARYRQLQRKCKSHEEEIEHLRRTVDRMTMEVKIIVNTKF